MTLHYLIRLLGFLACYLSPSRLKVHDADGDFGPQALAGRILERRHALKHEMPREW
jgi:hypothetical protein